MLQHHRALTLALALTDAVTTGCFSTIVHETNLRDSTLTLTLTTLTTLTLTLTLTLTHLTQVRETLAGADCVMPSRRPWRTRSGPAGGGVAGRMQVPHPPSPSPLRTLPLTPTGAHAEVPASARMQCSLRSQPGASLPLTLAELEQATRELVTPQSRAALGSVRYDADERLSAAVRRRFAHTALRTAPSAWQLGASSALTSPCGRSCLTRRWAPSLPRWTPSPSPHPQVGSSLPRWTRLVPRALGLTADIDAAASCVSTRTTLRRRSTQRAPAACLVARTPNI